MASKKHRQIVMNRASQPQKPASILKKAVLITAVLASIEVIILLIIHFNAANKDIVRNQQEANKAVVPPAKPPKDTTGIAAVIQPKEEAKTENAGTVVKKQPLKVPGPVSETAPALVQAPTKDTIARVKAKPKEIAVARKVTDQKMFEILNQVRFEKLKTNNAAKCVSVRIVNPANEANASKITSFLRKNGYVIAGRRVVSGNQKGFSINAEGDCLVLFVGTL